MSSSRQNDDYRDGEYGSKSYRSYRNTQDRGSHREGKLLIPIYSKDNLSNLLNSTDYSAVSPIEHHSSPHPSPTTPSSPKHSRKNLSELSNQLPYTPSHPRVRDLKDNMGPPITKSSYRSRGHDRARSTSNGYEMTHSSPVRARGYVDETKTSSDVRDWLKLTGWHDEDFRSQKLAEFRTEMRAEEEQHAINAVTEGMSGSHKGGKSTTNDLEFVRAINDCSFQPLRCAPRAVASSVAVLAVLITAPRATVRLRPIALPDLHSTVLETTITQSMANPPLLRRLRLVVTISTVRRSSWRSMRETASASMHTRISPNLFHWITMVSLVL